jgi:hypothetical protein
MKLYAVRDQKRTTPTYVAWNLILDVAKELCQHLNENDEWFSRYKVEEMAL